MTKGGKMADGGETTKSGKVKNLEDAKKVVYTNNKFFKETNQSLEADVVEYIKKIGDRDVQIIKVVIFKKDKMANGGGVDINELNMPVIRTQFEDEDYEFEDGGEVTANERMQSLKNYPKLKF